MSVDRTALHARAARASDRILERLADPETTAAATRIPPEAADDGLPEAVWAELSLGSGSPGVAMAFSGSARPTPEKTRAAHRYLGVATRAAGTGAHPASGVFKGPGALAFAVLLAHRATGGYVSVLRQLDDFQRQVVRTALPAVPDDAPVPTMGHFEVVRGATGLGRYLLARADTCGEELDTVLRYLTELAVRDDVPHQEHHVPRWWALDAPRVGQEQDFPYGHLNLGLSHGIAGPLALLSLAWQQGVRVPRQQEAVERTAALLLRWRQRDAYGTYWPAHLDLDEYAAGPDALAAKAGWPSWCYGTPGVSRALQLAGRALGRADWTAAATDSLARLLVRPMDEWGVNDHALCHGWGGALHLLGLLNEDAADPRIESLRDAIAERLVDAYDEEAPFGYRFTMTKVPYATDMSGYLDGAAGLSLALDAYASGGASHLGWDMPLLLS
ncbi:lanthionine synthetase C family protein [Streptomyces sp. NPDC054863]